MALTQAQQTVLKTHIEASVDPVITQALTDGTHDIIAKFYSSKASPDYICWRSSMSVEEIRELVDWNEVVNRTTNDLLAFQVLTSAGFVNPSKTSVRQAFASIFSGGTGTNTRAALLAAAFRLVNLVEQILSLNLGAGTLGDPDSLDFEGSVSHQDISKALING